MSVPQSPDTDPAPKSALAGMRAFSHRDFRYFWATRVAGILATEMLVTTVGWQVYRLTASELNLGLIGFAQFAPFALLFLVSGVAADRLPRMRIIFGCVSLQTVCAAVLLWGTWSGHIDFTIILAILVLFGVARAFQAPAQMAIVPNLVPSHDLANAIAWSSSGFQMARIIGPTIAGLLISFGAARGEDEFFVYVLAVAVFVLATILAAMVRSPVQIVSQVPISVSNILAGFKFIASRQVIFGAIGLDLFAVLFGGAIALLPVYATTILNVGADGFGILRSAFTFGGFVGAIYMTQRPVARQAGIKLLLAVGIFGLGVIVFGISEIFWLSLGALVVMGLADSVSVFIRQNLVQIITPDEMRGRVSAVTAVFIGASNELGEFESGVTAHWWGTVPAVIVGGAATVTVAVSFAWLFPKLREVDSLEPDELIRKYRDPSPGS
ncbi:MAG: MFS transporter [Alphaproteobacteria bacterium]|jgi:MFS family permease|nr:MFS transporter [Alphaproteobacteria bacterium]